MPRRPDLSRDAFQTYYESRHAPLAIRHIHCFVRYVRNHVVVAQPEVPFDTLSEFWFENVEASQSLIEWHSTPDALELQEDEARFMDRQRVVAFPVVETVVFGSTQSLRTASLTRETLLFTGNFARRERSGTAFVQLACNWAKRDGLVCVCLDLPLSTADLLPEWTVNAEAPIPSALLTGWRYESRTITRAPLLPSGAADLGCTHHLVFWCAETSPDHLGSCCARERR